MNNPSHPRRIFPLFVCSLIAAVLLTLSVRAQSATTGSIQGRIYNPASKQYVKNAEVRLDGTNQVAYSEADGTFRIDNVPAGPASITVNFTGYTSEKAVFTVAAGQSVVREISLTSTAAEASGPNKDGVVKLDVFSVSSEREGNSKAIMAQRRDMNIITSVSSDVFGQVPDGNVGEFLKYLPGVDLDYVESEPRGPRLGGMDGQYVGVSFDGMRNASADANRGGGSASRGTSFEGFSITSIESVEINRTASAENDGDSPAGTVNMKTKRAFQQQGRHFDYNYGITINGEEWTLHQTRGPQDRLEYKWAPSWQLGYSESFFDHRLGLLLSASHSNSYTEQASVNVDYNRGPVTDARPLVVRDINFTDGPKFIIKDALLLAADWKATPRLVLSTNLIYSYFEGNFANRSFDFVAANNNTNADNGRNTVGGDGILTVIAPRDFTAVTGAAGAVNGVVLNNNTATLNNAGGSSAKLTYSRQYSERFEYKLGAWTIDGYLAFSKALNNYESIERGFSSNEGGGVASGWTATRPNPRSWEWTVRQNTGADWFDLRSFTSTNPRTGGTSITNDNRTWITEKWTTALNAKWNVPFWSRFPTVIKFGGKWDEEARKNRTDSALNVASYNGPGGNTTTVSPTTGGNVITTFGNWANVGPQYISPFPFDMGTTNAMAGGGVYNINGVFGVPPRANRDEIAHLYYAHPELWVNTSTPEDYYTANYANARHFVQTINAGYAQADVRLTSKLQIRVGARVEQTKNALREFNPLTSAQVAAAGYPVNPPGTNAGRPVTIAGMKYMFESKPMVTRHSQYHDFFPSVLAKYQILPNLEWQAGFNKGISRPGIDNLTGLFVQNDNANPPTVNAPNPTLQPEHHKVYQTRLSYYFGGKSPGEVSVAYIQDEAVNFIQTRNYTPAEFGVTDPAFSNYVFVSTTNAPALQRYKNFDFNYNQTLGFLPINALRGISVGTTFSRSYANQRRNNLAPFRATARLGYSYRRFGGSIAAIWIDDRPRDGIYGRVWGAMTKVDLSLTWSLTRYATLFATGRNIANQKDLYYESAPGVQEGKQKNLRNAEAYGDNWIFGVRGAF